jgi:hypothetical protein
LNKDVIIFKEKEILLSKHIYTHTLKEGFFPFSLL